MPSGWERAPGYGGPPVTRWTWIWTAFWIVVMFAVLGWMLL